ncbi:MAG: RecX family transcriptional regulator [Solirubrobacterales bacterium]|nr:RecX family transcriptional regulator [Solirubrobacterales bacterium]
MRRHLEARGVEAAVAAEAVDELEFQGYLDDARFAKRYAEDRRALDDWGPERIERRLLEAGVERDLVTRALAARGAEDELAAAVALLRRRFPTPPATDRERGRALGLLVRRGFDLELAHDAVRARSREQAA